MFILTFLSTFLILSRGKTRRPIDGYNVEGNDWEPFLFASKDSDESSKYDVTHWVRELHLQQCAFVEIGEGFCALFVELRSITSDTNILDTSGVGEFFLGICPCATFRTWDLCSTELKEQRGSDCTFAEATPYSNTSARVHRRLCDITLLSKNAPICNCTVSMAGQELHNTKGCDQIKMITGFPTCFLSPLPESLCSPRGVCGIAQCSATTIKGIHSPRCASNCHQRQPFCEEIGPRTSMPPEINSHWSRWSSPKCNNNCGRGLMVAIALCHDQVTCPDEFGKCYCEVNVADGIMRVSRFTEPCVSIEGCIPGNDQTLTLEGELDPDDRIAFGKVYPEDDRESFEDTHHYSQSLRPAQRRLLQVHRRSAEYDSLENRLPNKNFKSGRVYRSVPGSRLADDYEDDYEEDEQDEGNDEDGESLGYEGNDDEDEEREDDGEEEENKEETIGLGGSAKGRRSPRKRTRVARSDYAAFASEGKPGVDELETTTGPTEIESVTEVCEDDSTEATEEPQYYDYETGGNSTASRDGLDGRVMFSVKLVALNVLLVYLE